MTYLLTLLFTLWLAAQVWADYLSVCPNEDHNNCITYDPDRVSVQPDCLVQMEAAMRAMERFSAGGPYPMWNLKEGYLRVEQHGNFQDALLRARKQWDAAKRECWK